MADKEVQTLRITHFGEVIGDSLYYIFKLLFLRLVDWYIKGTLDIFLNLDEALVVDDRTVQSILLPFCWLLVHHFTIITES